MIKYYEINEKTPRKKYREHLNSVLKIMEKNDVITTKQLHESLGLSEHYIREMLRTLLFHDKIIRHVSRRSWMLKK